jgi:transposase
VNTNAQFNLPPLPKKLRYASNRSDAIAQSFADPSTRLMVASDLVMIDHYDQQIHEMESYLVKSAKVDDAMTFGLLRTIPGIGPILGLILLYEIDDQRFPKQVIPGRTRLKRCEHSIAGKVKGSVRRRSAPHLNGRSAKRRA